MANCYLFEFAISARTLCLLFDGSLRAIHTSGAQFLSSSLQTPRFSLLRVAAYLLTPSPGVRGYAAHLSTRQSIEARQCSRSQRRDIGPSKFCNQGQSRYHQRAAENAAKAGMMHFESKPAKVIQ